MLSQLELERIVVTICFIQNAMKFQIFLSAVSIAADNSHVFGECSLFTRDAEPEPEPVPEPPEPTHFGRSRRPDPEPSKRFARSRSRSPSRQKMGRLRLRKGIQLWQEKNSSKIKRNSRAKSLPKFVINN